MYKLFAIWDNGREELVASYKNYSAVSAVATVRTKNAFARGLHVHYEVREDGTVNLQDILDWQSANQRLADGENAVGCSHRGCDAPAEIMLQGYPVCAACHTGRIVRGQTVVGCAHCDPESGRWVVKHNRYEEA